MLDLRVVIDQFRYNRLFLQAFNGGLDQCDIFEGSFLISSAYVFCGVCKTPESNMSLPSLHHHMRGHCHGTNPLFLSAQTRCTGMVLPDALLAVAQRLRRPSPADRAIQATPTPTL